MKNLIFKNKLFKSLALVMVAGALTVGLFSTAFADQDSYSNTDSLESQGTFEYVDEVSGQRVVVSSDDIYNLGNALDTVVYNEADAYNPKQAYLPGALVVYRNSLYKCVQNTSGAFDSSCWVSTTLGSQIVQSVSDIETGVSVQVDSLAALVGADTYATEAYVPGKAYRKGDYCINRDALFRCIQDTSAENFERKAWVRTTIASELNQLKHDSVVISYSNSTGVPTLNISNAVVEG